MKYYNFETTDKYVKESLRRHLKRNGIYYEISGCGNGWHFEIYCDKNTLQKTDDFLTKIEEYREKQRLWLGAAI